MEAHFPKLLNLSLNVELRLIKICLLTATKVKVVKFKIYALAIPGRKWNERFMRRLKTPFLNLNCQYYGKFPVYIPHFSVTEFPYFSIIPFLVRFFSGTGN